MPEFMMENGLGRTLQIEEWTDADEAQMGALCCSQCAYARGNTLKWNELYQKRLRHQETIRQRRGYLQEEVKNVLFSLLDEEQRSDYLNKGQFTCQGQDGSWFTIVLGSWSGNVIQYSNKSAARARSNFVTKYWCGHIQRYNQCSLAEHHLAQYLMITCNTQQWYNTAL